MASRVGAPVNVTFGASFTVPSGANAFIASGIWYDGANQAVTNVSGSRVTVDNVAAVASSGSMGVYSVRGRVNSSGSDTWSITKAGFFSEGPTCQVQFYSVADNTNFVRQQQVVGDTSGAISRSVTSTTSDLVDAWIMSDGGGTVSGAISGFTAVGTEQTVNADKSRVFTANSPGASSTSITGPANSFPGLVIASIYDAGGGSQTVSPGLLTNTSTLYAPTVTRGAVSVSPSLLTNTSTIYAATVVASYTVSPGLFTNSSTLYSPTVVPGSVSVQPPLLTNTSTLYSPVVSQSGGSQVVAPGLLINTSTLYGPTISVGPVSVTAPLLTNSQAFYGATVQPGQITISAPLLMNTSTLYASSVSVGTATVSPPLLTSANALFAPAVVPGGVSVQPGVLTNTSVLYAPTVTQYAPGSQVVQVPLLANTSTVYAPTVSGGGATEGSNLTRAAPGLTPKIWPSLWIRYEGKPKKRIELLEEEERERIEEIAEQAVIEAASEKTKKAMRESLQASMRAAEIELATTSYLRLVEQAAALRMEQIEEEDIAVVLALL